MSSIPEASVSLSADQLVAHRGYQRHYPENSPLALEKAIACGACYVEIDVQFSADGVPLLYHDDTLERISGREGRLSQYHFRALQELTAGEPERLGNAFAEVRIVGLVELVNVLRRHPQVQAFVELKEEAVRDYGAHSCLGSIRETLAPVIDRCVLISFDLDALREARALGFRRIGAVLRDWSARHALAAELGAEVMFCNTKRIGENDSLHIEDCAVAVYEVDDVQQAQYWLARGARWVESFAIGELLGSAA